MRRSGVLYGQFTENAISVEICNLDQDDHLQTLNFEKGLVSLLQDVLAEKETSNISSSRSVAEDGKTPEEERAAE